MPIRAPPASTILSFGSRSRTPASSAFPYTAWTGGPSASSSSRNATDDRSPPWRIRSARRSCSRHASGSRLAPRGRCVSEIAATSTAPRLVVRDLLLQFLVPLRDRWLRPPLRGAALRAAPGGRAGLRGRPADHRAGAGRTALAEERCRCVVSELLRRDALAARGDEAALPAAAHVRARRVPAVPRRLVDEQEELHPDNRRVAGEVLRDHHLDVRRLRLLADDVDVFGVHVAAVRIRVG